MASNGCRAHAIVIGIDDYRVSDWRLDSAVADALGFLRWALESGGASPTTTTALLAPRPLARELPAGVTLAIPDKASIQDELRRYAFGAASGERLYFFFAGHGIAAPNVGIGAGPVLVPVDVTDLSHDHLLCQLDVIVDTLQGCRPREQYFFVDACRDFALEDKFQAMHSAGAWLPRPGIVGSSQYGLFAAAPGQRAYGHRGHGVFSRALLDALSGNGPRLNARGPMFELTFDGLVEFVRDEAHEAISRSGQKEWEHCLQIPQRFTRCATGTGRIWSRARANVGMRTASVTVLPSPARVVAQVSIVGYDEPAPRDSCAPPLPLPVLLKAPPGDYELVVDASGFRTVRLPLTLWRSMQMRVELPSVDSAIAFEGFEGDAELAVDVGDGGLLVEIVRPDGGVERGRDRVVARGGVGVYLVRVSLPDGEVLQRDFVAGVGFPSSWRPEFGSGHLNDTIAGHLRAGGILIGRDGYITPSKVLGSIPELSLGGILGLAAYSDIWPYDDDFVALRRLGIQTPHVVSPRSAITVLVAAADEQPWLARDRESFLARVDVGFHGYAAERRQPAGFPAAIQVTAEVDTGIQRVTIALPGRPTTVHAVATVPGWVSVMVIVVQGLVARVQHYMILGDRTKAREVPHPRVLLDAERAQRQLAADRLDDIQTAHLNLVIRNKWADPLFACIAGYALARQGELRRWCAYEHPEDWRPMRNMLVRFPELPDSHVLAGLAEPDCRDEHFRDAVEYGAPMFAEGLRELYAWFAASAKGIPSEIAEPYSRLLPGAIWTSWLE